MIPEIRQQLARLGIDPGAIRETFARASGPGGQHVNKVSTAVTLVCPEENLTITAQDSRSQARNREVAWQRLVGAIRSKRAAARSARRDEREKSRRRSRPRPRGLKERILKTKKKRGQVKRLRGKVGNE